MMTRKTRLLPLLALLILVTGCVTTTMADKHDTAQSIAVSGNLQMTTVRADPFVLTAYQRIKAPGQAANIYIEGDGQAWLSKAMPSQDPTPTNPVALGLAALDPNPNVIYIARPCQYTKMIDANIPCPRKYWMEARMAPEIVTSINSAIDQIKSRYNLTTINLIGFSGGGTIAPLLAARRDDVLTIRTVAGNIDHEEFTRHHNVSPMSASLNAADVARQINNIPQTHYIGGKDRIIKESIYRSYAARAGDTSCMALRTVGNATHTDGWVTRWPELLAEPVKCIRLGSH